MFFSKQHLCHRRRHMRNFPTEAERRLWFVLRKHGLCGVKFRRQTSIGIFIVDFYCPAIRLAVEVDGSQHYTKTGLALDRERTAYLTARGVRLARVTNADVYWRMESVIEYLTNIVDELMMKNTAMR